MKKIWDYTLKKNWRPQTTREWVWYLERKIQYDDWARIKKKPLMQYFQKLKIDPGKKLMIQAYLEKYAK